MKDFGIERLGTHPLENFNGYIREQACSKDTLYTIHTVCAKSQMMKAFAVTLGISTKKRNRANAGGLKISEFSKMCGINEEEIDYECVANTLFLLNDFFSNLVILNARIDCNDVNNFFDWVVSANSLSNLEFVQKIRLSDPSKASNSRIQARNISYLA